MRMIGKSFRASLALALLLPSAALAQTVAVITPYLAQPGTQFYVDAFQARAAELGWDVNVIDTAGDVAAVVSRLEDSVTQKVDAIVVNVDPAQVGAGLEAAQGGRHPGLRHGRRRRSAARHQRHLERLRHGGGDRGLCREPAERQGPHGHVRLRSLPAGPGARHRRRRDLRELPRHRGGRPRDPRRRRRRHRRQPRQDGGDPRRQPRAWVDQRGLGGLGPAGARRAAGHRGGGPPGRGHRDQRHRRQPAGARRDRDRRQLRGLHRPGLRRHRHAPPPRPWRRS